MLEVEPSSGLNAGPASSTVLEEESENGTFSVVVSEPSEISGPSVLSGPNVLSEPEKPSERFVVDDLG